MYGRIKVTSTLVRVEVNWKEGAANWSERMPLPVSHNISLSLLVAQQLNINGQLAIELSSLISQQHPFEQTHLIYADLLVLNRKEPTTFRMMNFRERKVLLLPSISEVLVGSTWFRVDLLLISDYDLKVRNGTAKVALWVIRLVPTLLRLGRQWLWFERNLIGGCWLYLDFWGWSVVSSSSKKAFKVRLA